MRASQLARYAVRLNYVQVASEAKCVSQTTVDRNVARSAALLAAFGIALSSFSLKQLLNKPAAARKL